MTSIVRDGNTVERSDDPCMLQMTRSYTVHTALFMRNMLEHVAEETKYTLRSVGGKKSMGKHLTLHPIHILACLN